MMERSENKSLKKKPWWKIFPECDLLILIAAMFIMNLHAFFTIYLPHHDTKQTFETFYFFYNELFFFGQVPHWMPYYNYGIPAFYDQVMTLTPMSYVAMLLGVLFKIKDAFFLFRFSLVLDQLVLLLGVYLLSKHLFKRRITVFLICLSSITMVYWQSQVFYDYRIGFMFPFMVYFLLLFFERKDSKYLWMTGMTLLAAVMGLPLYNVVLWVFILFAFFVVLFLYDRDIWRSLLRFSPTNMSFLLIFIFLGFCFLYPLKNMINHAQLIHRIMEGKNSLGFFLTWGGKPFRFHGLIGIFLFAQRPEFYAGIFCFIFFLWALMFVREKRFYALLSSLVALLCVSTGGVLACFIYFFPGMAYFRHIGYMGPLLKILIVICAGFGLEAFLEVCAKRQIAMLLLVALFLVFLADLSGVPWIKLSALSQHENYVKTLFEGFDLDHVLVRFAGYAIALGFIVGIYVVALILKKLRKRSLSEEQLKKIILFFLVAALLVDLASQQALLRKQMTKLSSGWKPYMYTFNVHKPEFLWKRFDEPQGKRQQDASALSLRDAAVIHYTLAYNFIQMDPCRPALKTHFIPRRLSRLYHWKGTGGEEVKRISGCQAPKLRLIPRAVFAEDQRDAEALIREAPELCQTVVLSHVASEDRITQDRPSQEADQKIVIEKFTANELIASVDVPYPDGAWLVYADSYHPQWRAKVNGKKVPTYPAYHALRAVYLNYGSNRVHFYFSGLVAMCGKIVALFGILFGLFLLVNLVRVSFSKKEIIP